LENKTLKNKATQTMIENLYKNTDKTLEQWIKIVSVENFSKKPKTQPKVKSIIASTEKANTASFRVLEKNMFQKIEETEMLYNWQLKLYNQD
jgi:hypothetical protein